MHSLHDLAEVAAHDHQEYIEAAKSDLMAFADALAERQQERGEPWDVIVGEDTSGRLPALFARNVIGSITGQQPKIRFLNTSKGYRNELGPAPYEAWFNALSDEFTNPLVVTEVVASAKTHEFLRKVSSAAFPEQHIDFAAVNWAKKHDDEIPPTGLIYGREDSVFGGGYPAFEATTFPIWEIGAKMPAVTRKIRILGGKATINATFPHTGLATDELPHDLPLSQRFPTEDWSIISIGVRAARQKIGAMAAEYLQSYSS